MIKKDISINNYAGILYSSKYYNSLQGNNKSFYNNNNNILIN